MPQFVPEVSDATMFEEIDPPMGNIVNSSTRVPTTMAALARIALYQVVGRRSTVIKRLLLAIR
jgi:hypothetical protein